MSFGGQIGGILFGVGGGGRCAGQGCCCFGPATVAVAVDAKELQPSVFGNVERQDEAQQGGQRIPQEVAIGTNDKNKQGP